MKTKEELLARLTEVKAEITQLNTTYEGQYIDPSSADGKNWNELNAEHDQLKKTIAQIEARESRLKELADNDDASKPGADFGIRRPGTPTGDDIYDLSTVRASLAEPQKARAELHDRAKRAIEVAKFPHQSADRARNQAHVERLLASIDDEHGALARRILVTGNPGYKDGFGKWIASGGTQFSASMQLGVDANGGFALPFDLDPTILLTSSGAVNPYRQISRVVQIVGKTWEGVSSAGVTAHRRAESGEASDDTLTLAQPSVTPTRVDVFIPFSIELQTSWGGMQGEIASLIQDAKDVEEATAFTTGNGTAPNPQGLVTGATISVNTAGTATFAAGDLDIAEQGLPNRFQPHAQWVGNRAIYNLVRHFDSAGGPNLWARIGDPLAHGGNTGRELLGYAANECSAMGATHASGDTLLVLGDFSRFLIVDRIGLNIELVPHLFALGNNRPSGERGFYAYWNNTCKVLTPEAFRVLKML